MRKSHTECKAGGRTRRECGGLWSVVKIKGKVHSGSGTVVTGRDMGVGECTWKDIGGRRNENAQLYDTGQEVKRDNQSGGNRKESSVKEVKVVWECDEKIGVGLLRREEDD